MKKEFYKISITGDLGSGKSLISKLLSDKLNYKIISTGAIQREIAQKYGMSTLDFNKYTESHPEVDDEIDARVTELQDAEENIIFDSRLAWHFAPKTFKIYLKVDDDIAANRIHNDKRNSEAYTSIEEAKNKIQERRKSEIERFKSYYGIDYSDFNNYNLIVDTSENNPQNTLKIILEAFEKYKKG